MTIYEAIILGFVQGLTEFFPVSSSGHLVLLQEIMGIVDPSAFFEIFLHFATLFAIIVFFRKRLMELKRREVILLGVASIPAGMAGLFLEDTIISFFSSVTIVSGMLLISGIINLLISRRLSSRKTGLVKLPEIKLSKTSALKVGLYQMLALIPGISRSGATVWGGLNQGLSRFGAFEFSFLMAVPVILGANVVASLQLNSVEIARMNLGVMTAGFTSSFVVGLASLSLLQYIMKNAKFEYFSFYCFLAGGGLLLASMLGFI